MLLWCAKTSLVDVDLFSYTTEKKMHNFVFERLEEAKMAIFKLSLILKKLKRTGIF